MQNNLSQDIKKSIGGGDNLTVKILLSFVLLASFLFSIINVTGAWFTDSSGNNKTINAVIKTSEANLNVYQEDSNGTQTLLSKSLPTGYTQLEYIESTGTQNISTNYVWKNEKTKVYIDATVTTFKAPSTLFGAQYWDDADSHVVWLYCPYDNTGNGHYTVYAGKTYFSNILRLNQNERFKAEFSTTNDNKIEVKLNGTSVLNSTYTGSMVVNSSRGINLFSSSGDGNNQYEIMGGMRCYAFKMWDNDILVRDLVPAKNASGTIGMYDLVEDKFYTNASTGTFTAGAEQIAGTGVSLAYDSSNRANNKVTLSELPTGYTQLEYIESTGTQYIDTGLTMEKTDSVIMKINANLVNNGSWGGVNGYMQYQASLGEGKKGTFIVDYNGNSNIENVYFNEELKYTKNWSTLYSGVNNKIAIIGMGTANNTWWTTGGNLAQSGEWYGVEIYFGSNLVRNFIPVKNASGTIGMYDTVEGKFYTNAGTGTFTAGTEVNQLKLLLKNEDLGSSFGIRYKVNFYATTLNGKVLLTSSIADMTAPTSSTNGFVYNSTDGYYYYQNSSGQNVVFEPATSSAVTSKYLMQSFSIDFSSVSNLLGGNSIYMEILVESVNV